MPPSKNTKQKHADKHISRMKRMQSSNQRRKAVGKPTNAAMKPKKK